jgi:signal transduction histidine kinase
MADTFRVDGRVPGHAVTLRWVLAEAFGDPTLEIAFPQGDLDDGWIGADGRPLTMLGDREIREIRDDGTLVAAIVHDEALDVATELMEAGVAMARVVLDNQRLHDSRARLTAGAERERRRIERDLHDGAQQRLVALRIELELAEELVRRDPARGADRLRDLEHEVDEALEELRTLAHGVYPPLLAGRGLPDALRAATARSRLSIELDTREVERYPPEVESAVYFCMLEGVQNATKHAEGATRAVIRLDGSTRGELRFELHDDGAGAPDGAITPGAGITNMHDRLAAIGGDLMVSSSEAGTIVRGRAPTDQPLARD